MTYQDKLKDEKWLKKRERILADRKEQCQSCGVNSGAETLTIHHGYYRPKADPWNYEEETLWALCWTCHKRVQKILTSIHRAIGQFHPDKYLEIERLIGQSLFELRFGVSEQDAEDVLNEELAIEANQYSEYSILIAASDKLGPSKASELEDSIIKRFPGVDISIFPASGERDAVANVSGPNVEVVQCMQSWCDRQQG